MKVVTRYAPSPTGPQHIGGLRTALYCYLFARKHGGEFILRIEDTDQTRFVPGAEEFIVEACNWIGIQFTQGVHTGGPHAPYRQSERSEIYKQYAQQLIEKGHAYIAFDTAADIEEMKKKLEANGVIQPQYNYLTRSSMKNSLTLPEEEVKRRIAAGEPYVVRFAVPRKDEVRFHDEVRGWVVIPTSSIDDKVLLKSDGLPTYHLANVVDDHLMEVTHVIRAEEWLPSTPLHVLLYKAFGWEETMPKFAHLSLLINPDNSKMSKRNADKFGIPIYPLNWWSAENSEVWNGYREEGYLPEALANYIALLGWNPGTEKEIMSMDELVELFSLDKVSLSAAKFDLDKLKHFNQVYLRAKSDEELLPELKHHLAVQNIPYPGDAYMKGVIRLLRERVTFPRDFVTMAPYLFHGGEVYDWPLVEKKFPQAAEEIVSAFAAHLKTWEDWTAAALEAEFKKFAEGKGVKPGQMMMPLRISITGMGTGPSTFDTAELLGKKGTLSRMERILASIAEWREKQTPAPAKP